jgi:hypothetical protein
VTRAHQAAAVLLALVVPALLARAQEAPRGLALSLSASRIQFSDDVGPDDLRVIVGPSLGLAWLRGRGLGAEVAVTYLPPSGFYRLTGALAEAGAVLPIGGPRAAVLLRAGVSGVLAGNNDGGYLAGGGPYAGLGARVQAAERIGLRADVTGHGLRGDSPSAVGVAVGLTLLPRPRAGSR